MDFQTGKKPLKDSNVMKIMHWNSLTVQAHVRRGTNVHFHILRNRLQEMKNS